MYYIFYWITIASYESTIGQKGEKRLTEIVQLYKALGHFFKSIKDINMYVFPKYLEKI